MRFATVCSGIGAPERAWDDLGWTSVFASEIERFPSAVLAHHYPETPNFGDMTKFKEWKNVGSVDVICGGTPCQSFSVAGLRQGLADPRGNLMLVFGSLADHFKPRWLVWENVPGVLSSNRGRDFGAFLGMLVKLGYGVAYRVLDAQYFGLAQRRRRVFLVGYFGDWRCAAAVLFESESLCGHPPPRRETGKDVAPTIRSGPTNGGPGHGQRSGDTRDELIVPVARTVTARYGKGTDSDASDTLVTHSLRDEVRKMNIVGALAAEPGMKQTSYLRQAMMVRRLTPRECERLQGFPDDYTAIDFRGKPAADGPRYKALGNSMAVPVLRWLGERIEIVERMLGESVKCRIKN